MEIEQYDRAKREVAEAKTIPEVKDGLDKAEAMRIYAKRAKDFEMQNWAAEIRLRYERRLGMLLIDRGEAGLMNKGNLKRGDVLPPSANTSTGNPTLSDMGVSYDLSSQSQRIAKIPEEVFEKAISNCEGELTRSSVLKPKNGTHISQNSGNNEWYTPPEYIEAAVKVLGRIDLDPATSEEANRIVGASRIFTADDEGQKQEWAISKDTKVWMNPPYSQPLISEFCEKFVQELSNGIEGMILVNNATETNWFQLMAYSSKMICFPKSRVKFWAPGRIAAPLQGQAILYFGRDEDLFMKHFTQFGLIVKNGF